MLDGNAALALPEVEANPGAGEVPLLTEYDPHDVGFHYPVIEDIRNNFDYSQGVQQLLLSGSVGSGKSLLMGHVLTTHAIENPNTVVGLGRLTMPDLKDTILKMVLDHMGEPGEVLDYDHNKATGTIRFPNKSEFRCFSWHDKKYKKFRSHPFSAFGIEELTENDDKEFYDAILMRCGRSRHTKEKFVISATNPDDPEHWAYKKFIESTDPNIHVYYSLTAENKFLDPSYIKFLESNLDPLMAQRMLYGKWVSIGKENIYYNYSTERNYLQRDYKVKEAYPIHISFDQNIGEGKPMSCVFFQVFGNTFHFFNEAVIQGARTEDIMEDMANRGLLDHNSLYIINGDAYGHHNDTRNKSNDYEIIKLFLTYHKTKSGRPVRFKIMVPKRNPAIRRRHNLMNGLMLNVWKQVRFYVYVGAKTLHEGCKLTKLKKGGAYIEDDSKYYQHITTAAGYGVVTVIDGLDSQEQGTVLL